MKIGSLFSGYEGLGRGVQSVLGGDIAWVSDIDPGACKILAHRYPDVPNIGDITAVDWSAVEPVDVLTGGFPCTDVSSAGLRQGLTPDTRSGLWSQMAVAINKLRPPLVVIENVRGLLSATAEHPAHRDHFHPLRGAMEPCPWCVGDGSGSPLRALGAVLGDLADIGYDASWQGLRAADIGAPHGRFRVFVTAWPAADADDAGRREHGRTVAVRAEQSAAQRDGHAAADADGIEPERRRVDGVLGGAPAAEPREGDQRERAGHAAGDGCATPPHPADDGRERGRPSRHGRDGSADHRDAAADALGGGCDGWSREPIGLEVVGAPATGSGEGPSEWGPYEPAVRRWERLTRPAPAPTEPRKNGQPRLSPAFVEWMQGLPAGWVTDVPGLTRNEQLKALGNGVVPQQAAQALRMLLPDLIEVAA